MYSCYYLPLVKTLDATFLWSVEHKQKPDLIDVTKLFIVIEHNVCKSLIGVHAFTGCDSVSAFCG